VLAPLPHLISWLIFNKILIFNMEEAKQNIVHKTNGIICVCFETKLPFLLDSFENLSPLYDLLLKQSPPFFGQLIKLALPTFPSTHMPLRPVQKMYFIVSPDSSDIFILITILHRHRHNYIQYQGRECMS